MNLKQSMVNIIQANTFPILRLTEVDTTSKIEKMKSPKVSRNSKNSNSEPKIWRARQGLSRFITNCDLVYRYLAEKRVLRQARQVHENRNTTCAKVELEEKPDGLFLFFYVVQEARRFCCRFVELIFNLFNNVTETVDWSRSTRRWCKRQGMLGNISQTFLKPA